MAKLFMFKVNGVEIDTDQQSLSANEILELAKEKGAIPGKSGEVYSAGGDKGKYKGDDPVDLNEDNLFIAIPNGPHPGGITLSEMSDNIDRINDELKFLGYETCLSDSPQGKVVSFTYRVEVGPHKDKQFTLGISMQGSESYPDYPPHWIHLTPPIDDGRGGSINRYPDENGQEWIALSRPPGELWDQLATKHMRGYLNEHIRRFWNGM